MQQADDDEEYINKVEDEEEHRLVGYQILLVHGRVTLVIMHLTF